MNSAKLAALLSVFLVAGGVRAGDAGTASPSAAHVSYTADGRLEVPTTYRDWPFLTSGLDMNYASGEGGEDHHMFDNVFVDPDSLRAFRKTGSWPEGTVFVKEGREGLTKGSINRSGQFQAEPVMSLELHIKDSARFEGGWGFFDFGGNAPAQKIPLAAGCYSCHQSHGAVETTFVQFYPTLIGVARSMHTLSTDTSAGLARREQK
jgi:hypothetical protein